MKLFTSLYNFIEGPIDTPETLAAQFKKFSLNEHHEAYLTHRWIQMVIWWQDRSTAAKMKFFLLRGVVVLGGVSLPVLSTISLYDPKWQSCLAIVIAITGAVVAACSAWEGVKNYGGTWLEKRRASELLKVEGQLFLHRSGKYANPKQDPFSMFVTEVEAMIAREVGQYTELFARSVEAALKDADEFRALITKAVKDALKEDPKP